MLTTAALKLSELLSGPFLLNVPIYQRPYSWGEHQVQQLIDDLLEAAGLGFNSEADDSYYLGAILLMDAPGHQTLRLTPKMSAREFDVVDGQQRLVTLLTLFCIFRDLDAKKAVARRVQAMVQARQGGRFFPTERVRMRLSSLDRAIFEKYVLPDGATAQKHDSSSLSQSELALLAMRDLLMSEMKSLTEESRAALFDYISERCNVVVIVSHDIDKAHRMFVVMNERGTKLKRDEILKADILSRTPAADHDRIAQTWDETSGKIGKDFESFFTHIHKIYGSGHRQIVAGVRSVITAVGGAQAFMTTVFLPLARAYQIVCNGNAPGLPAEIGRRLHYLNRLGESEWAPAAMLALKDWESDPDHATLLIAEIDRMAHIMRVLAAGASRRGNKFSEIVAAIKSGVPLDEHHPAFQLTREEARIVAFNLKDPHKRGPKICKLLLMRLGDEMAGHMQNANPADYTIEHILPQRPSATSEWRRIFPTAEDRSQCVESIGNLVLITQYQNDKARNGSFAAKKAIYAQASERTPLLAITADILEREQWRREEIEEREHRLLAMIANHWRIDFTGKTTPRGGSGSSGSEMVITRSEERRSARTSRA